MEVKALFSNILVTVICMVANYAGMLFDLKLVASYTWAAIGLPGSEV